MTRIIDLPRSQWHQVQPAVPQPMPWWVRLIAVLAAYLWVILGYTAMTASNVRRGWQRLIQDAARFVAGGCLEAGLKGVGV